MKSTKSLLILFHFTVLILTSCQAQNLSLSPEQWKKDVDYFGIQIVKKHKNAYHSISETEFQQAINNLKKDLPQLNQYQVFTRLQQITAKIGDGHTYVLVPKSFHRYPFSTFWFGDQLYVTRATDEYKHVLGMRLKKINNFNIEDVNEKISTLLSTQENKWYSLATSPFYLSIPEYLNGLGVIDSLKATDFIFLDSNNREVKVNVRLLQPEAHPKWIFAPKVVPLFLQRDEESYWFTLVEDIEAVYVNFKSYDDFKKNTEKLFEFIEGTHAKRLILDIRNNRGGDFTKVREKLIPRIIKNSTINQKGNLFVITGRRTFSAAMTNSIDFKNLTNATIIGEPPGERPNSYQEKDDMRLPNSGLVISFSTKYYKFLPEDVPEFKPDILIETNWKDYLRGIDPIMEYIKTSIKLTSTGKSINNQ